MSVRVLSAALLALAASPMLGACASTNSQIASPPLAQQQLQTAFQAEVDKGQVPGAIAIIEADGRELAKVRVGFNDIASGEKLQEDAIFRLYSMSKPITSVAIMMLAEDGKLSLDDPAEKFLPEWHDMRVYVSGNLDNMVTEPVKRPITIADLLTHRAGITYHFMGQTPVHQYYRKYGVMRDTPVGRLPTDGAPARDLNQLVERLGEAPMLRQPGEAFDYSYSTTMLGAIVERASGKRLDKFLKERIFDPLGMSDTGFFIDDDRLARFTTLYAPGKDGLTVTESPETSDYRDHSRLLDGGGAIAGTAADYLRFANMLANGGILDNKRILSEKSVDAMFTPRVDVAIPGSPPMRFGYGFAIGDAASAAAGGLPDGAASWSGSGNTYFFVDRKHRGLALLMTHFLGEGDAQKSLRSAVNRAYSELAPE